MRALNDARAITTTKASSLHCPLLLSPAFGLSLSLFSESFEMYCSLRFGPLLALEVLRISFHHTSLEEKNLFITTIVATWPLRLVLRKCMSNHFGYQVVGFGCYIAKTATKSLWLSMDKFSATKGSDKKPMLDKYTVP
jgi:uncharacterized membrane protein